MELTLERAQLRCGRMGGGGDPPVDTEEEEADDVSDVTLPRAAAVPSALVSKCSSDKGVRCWPTAMRAAVRGVHGGAMSAAA